MKATHYKNLLLDFVPVTEYLRQVVLGASRFCTDEQKFRVRIAIEEASLLQDDGQVDGVLAVIENANPHHPATRFGSPVVNISTFCSPVPFPTVALDNPAVGRAAAEHLLSRGYRSFGFHWESRLFFSSERKRGFIDTLKRAGYPCAEFDTGRHAKAVPAENHDATIQWLRDLPKPLGLGGHNDTRAAALLDLCIEAGINVPEEVGIIGVDNDLMAGLTRIPNLTSVDSAASNIGYRAAELLCAMLEGRPAPDSPIYLPPREVVARASTEPRLQIDPRLADAQRYIAANADKSIGVDDVLEATAVSRSSLERLFKVHIGRSPAEEIRRVRVNCAKWRLIGSQSTIADIADGCGFTSVRSFAKAFSAETGVTPTVYRQRVLTGIEPAPESPSPQKSPRHRR